jgi:mRNA interferase HigB
MNIIARSRLREFQDRFPDAKGQLERWFKICKQNDFSSFAELKRVIGSADMVGKCLIFNIKGNQYRLIVRVNFKGQRMYIKDFLPHAEYDKLDLKKDTKCAD